MRSEEFIRKYSREIEEIFAPLEKSYNVPRDDFAMVLHTTAEKYLFKGDDSAEKDVPAFLAQLNAQDLCFAFACAQGNETAWEDFMREYRGFLQAVARQLTNNETTAEELVEVAWTELYGLREAEGKRISKFSSYSGRGSLKGWLRAVLFQLSVDRHRRQGRLVQTEEERDFERLAPPVAPISETANSSFTDKFRSATQAALAKALTELEAKMKLMLSYYYYDNLTLKQIGQLFGVHEATASRWLQRAQQDVRAAVEKILKQDFKYNSVQIEECLTLAAENELVDVRGMLVQAEPPVVDRGS